MANSFPSARGSNLILYKGETFPASRGSSFVDFKRVVPEYFMHGRLVSGTIGRDAFIARMCVVGTAGYPRYSAFPIDEEASDFDVLSLSRVHRS